MGVHRFRKHTLTADPGGFCQNAPREAPVPPSGKLWEGVLPGVLRELYVGRKTGVLSFTRGDERRSVHVRNGHIVSGDTTVREDRMGEVLVAKGLLAPADLKRAMGFALRDGKRLGEVLLEQGLLDERGLEQALALHVHAVLSKVFSWPEGSYEFAEDVEGEGPADVTLRVTTGDLILEATRSVQDPDVVRYNLGDIDRVLGLSSDPLLRFQRIALTPADGYLLSRIDGTLSAREVMQLAPLPAEEVQRSLFGLLSTGVVEYLDSVPAKPAPPPAPAPPRAVRKPAEGARPPTGAASESSPGPVPPPNPPVPSAAVDTRRTEIIEAFDGLRTRTHYEILGIGRDATESQVKEAYFRMAKRFHPDVHHDEALHDLRHKLEAVFIRLGEAYEVLRNPRIRASYERQLGPVPGRDAPPADAGPPAQDEAALVREAEEAIRRAGRSMAEEKYWEAIQLLETSITRVEGKLKQNGRILLARAYAKNPNWVKQGEELLQQVIREDPQNVDAHFQLGSIYRSRGLRSRAAAMLRRVLDVQPDHEEARALIEGLDAEPPPSPPEAGLFKKLLRRK
jgi:curved DNA-binding protein CbpA